MAKGRDAALEVAPIVGFNSPRRPFMALIGIDLRGNEEREAVTAILAIAAVAADLDIGFAFRQSTDETQKVDSLLVGFSARFFFGPASPDRDLAERATRFKPGMAVPRCLKAPKLRGDDRFRNMSPDLAARQDEADLLLWLEAGQREIGSRLLEALRGIALVDVRFFEQGLDFVDGCNALGYREGLSNLDEEFRTDPAKTERYLFVGTEDAKAFEGGSYLVYRNYRYDLVKWFAETTSMERDIAVGRSAASDSIIDSGGCPVTQVEPTAVARAVAPRSHVAHANPRGFAKTQFGDSISPPDYRILRRGYEFEEANGRAGLHFLCFQSDIQRRGFEFIYNNWIMPAGFNGQSDALIDPARGYVIPGRTVYVIVPKFDRIPGDCFLEGLS